MKQWAVSGALYAALVASSATAADLPKLKSGAVELRDDWSGAYLGLNAGGLWGNNNATNISTWPAKDLAGYWTTGALLSGGLNAGAAAGVIGGGQAGYNWRMDIAGGRLVAGLEADFQGVASNKASGQAPMSVAVLSFSNHNNFTTYNTRGSSNYLSYLGTARGRIGLLLTPALLVYGTGGLAYGGANLSLNQFQQFGVAIGWSDSNSARTLAGWTAGGGVEWMFLPNWSAKAEYLYYDLGVMTTQSQFVAYSPSGAQWTYGAAASRRFSGNLARIGVNYHFNWTPSHNITLRD